MSGGSSSLELSTSSGMIAGNPGIAIQDSDSRSSSVRSAKRGREFKGNQSHSAIRRTASGSSRQQPDRQRTEAQTDETSQTTYQQLNQVHVAPRMDAEVLRQAATEVMSANQAVADIKLEATQFASQTQSEAERIVAQAQASAERVVASTQVEASQALLNQEKQLRQTFEARERELLQRIQELSNSVAVVHQDNRDQTANGHGYFVSSD